MKDPGVTSFTIPKLSRFSSQEMLGSLSMSSLRGEIRLGTLSLKKNMLIFPHVLLDLVRI